MSEVRSRLPVGSVLLVFLAGTPGWAEQPAVLIPATDAPPQIDAEWALRGCIPRRRHVSWSIRWPMSPVLPMRAGPERRFLTWERFDDENTLPSK